MAPILHLIPDVEKKHENFEEKDPFKDEISSLYCHQNEQFRKPAKFYINP